MVYNSYLCGCYYYGTQVSSYPPLVKQYLPLLQSEAHTTILSTTSRTVIKQTFTNPSSEEAIKECIYTFPLYDGVSVVGFTCKVDSRVLIGIVKEKVKAKEIFDQAVTKGQTAGLLEQAPESSDVFSTKLGNIPAGKSVIVEITYVGEFKHHETEGIRFTIPTSIAPRYGQGPSHGTFGGTQAQPEGGIKITVDVDMPEGSFIKGVQSPSHPIAVSMGVLSTATDANPTMNNASATLSLGSAALEKDFVLIVQSKDIGIPKAILETHPTIPHHRALMATLVPRFTLPPSRPEIVFVADRSGSMRGNIPMLISAMKVFLKSMPVGVKFNICSFGNQTTFLWPKSKSYTSETLQEATSHIEGFQANMGGTETFKAIKSTIEIRYTDLPLEIMLLTDGAIWRQEELLAYVNQQVKESNGNIRIFPLGIGNGVSSALIDGLARAGNGFSQSVQDGESFDNSVVRMLRGALSPHITDYSLEVKYEKDDDDFELIDQVTEGLKVLLTDVDTSQQLPQGSKPTISLFDTSADPGKEDIETQDADYLPKVPHPKLLQAPYQIPSLFAFSRTTVYLLLSPETVHRNPTAVIFRATSAHGPLALEIPIEVLSTPAQTIHQLAARKAVQDLEEGRGWIYDARDQAGVLVKERYPSRFEDLVQREAVRLGERFGVAGKWCSFVAVEANSIQTTNSQMGQSAHSGEVDQGDGSHQKLSRARGSPPKRILDTSNFDAEFASSAPVDSYIDGPQLHSPTLKQEFSGWSYNRPTPASSEANSNAAAMQNYQMQNMLLEQQNKKRFQDGGLQPPSLIENQTRKLRSSAKSLSRSPFGALAAKIRPSNPFGSASASAAPGSGYGAPFGAQSILSGPSGAGQSLFGASAYAPTQDFGGSMSKGNLASPKAAEFRSSPKTAEGVDRGHSSSGSARYAGRIVPLMRNSSGSTKDPIVSYATLDMMIPPQPAPAPAPSEPVNWATKSVAEKIHALISLQDFEGSWSATEPEIPRIMGMEIPKAPDGVDEKSWITLLVTAYLEVNCAAEMGTWGLVAEKAKDWQAASQTWINSATGLESAWKQAKEFVKK